jgi:glycosyltransferase involved in cell wall biosynthesis
MECAIVTTDAGGIKELVRDGKDGFMKPVNEWMDLQEPLGKLIVQPELLKEFGVKARMRVMTSFSINTMVDQIENMYLDIIRQQK